MKEELVKLLKNNNSKEDGIWLSDSIEEYVNKIYTYSTIIPYFICGNLKGFISYYNNDKSKESAYLTMIVISKDYQGKGIGQLLLEASINDLKKSGFIRYSLEFLKTNEKAIRLYSNYGFQKKEDRGDLWLMEKRLNRLKKI